MPRFRYSLSKNSQPVSRNSDIWKARLPSDRQLFAGNCSRTPSKDILTYKDYFTAARIFLERNGCEVLTRAAGLQLGRTVCVEEIGEVRVSLEKHGQFYHPSRVEAVGPELTAAFVLNVAISATGRKWIKPEYDTLCRLKDEFSNTYLPRVYACGEVRLNDGGESLGMLLGEWFEGFHEFHVSVDPKTGEERIKVWDSETGDFFLSPDQTFRLYKEAAKILASYYNLQTFEQIFSWHHAAGDFVLKLEKERLEVRLITARQYLKLFQYADRIEKEPVWVLKALLVFFLYLSIRMRLDRLDGTGPVVWLGAEVLAGSVDGCFEALDQKGPLPMLPVPAADGLRACLHTLSEQDLLELLGEICATFSPASPDIDTIRQHLAQHARDLCRLTRLAQI